MARTEKRLDPFTAAYVEAMLWSTYDESDEGGGEPLDNNYGPGDIADETMELIVEDCADFQQRFGRLIESEPEVEGEEKWGRDELAGHDFWLTRSDSGTGFWDGDWPENGDALTEAAKSYGSFDLTVGEDADGDTVIYGPPPDWYRSHHHRGDVERLAGKPANPPAQESRRPTLRSTPIRAKYVDRKRLGEMMSPWGRGGDQGIGPVGSYYYGGHVYPDRKWVEGAIAQAEGYIPKAERGEHGWTKKDARDLRTIVAGLRYYLEHDYPGEATGVRAPRRGHQTQWSDWDVLDSVEKHHGMTPEAEDRAFELADLGYIDTTGTWKLTTKGRHAWEQDAAKDRQGRLNSPRERGR